MKQRFKQPFCLFFYSLHQEYVCDSTTIPFQNGVFILTNLSMPTDAPPVCGWVIINCPLPFQNLYAFLIHAPAMTSSLDQRGVKARLIAGRITEGNSKAAESSLRRLRCLFMLMIPRSFSVLSASSCVDTMDTHPLSVLQIAGGRIVQQLSIL